MIKNSGRYSVKQFNNLLLFFFSINFTFEEFHSSTRMYTECNGIIITYAIYEHECRTKWAQTEYNITNE